MLKYIVKRLLQLVPRLFVVSIIIFGMVRLSNIDPVSVIVGDKRSTPQVIAEVKEKYYFNKPLTVQYFIWISGLLRGDLGEDYKNKQLISSLISDSLPVTAGLVLLSSILSLFIAIPIGILSAVKKNTWIDRTLSVVTLIFVSSPGFLTGIILILIISLVAPDFAFMGAYSTFGEYIQRISLPFLLIEDATKQEIPCEIPTLENPAACTQEELYDKEPQQTHLEASASTCTNDARTAPHPTLLKLLARA